MRPAMRRPCAWWESPGAWWRGRASQAIPAETCGTSASSHRAAPAPKRR